VGHIFWPNGTRRAVGPEQLAVSSRAGQRQPWRSARGRLDGTEHFWEIAGGNMSLETVLVYKKRARSNGAQPVTASGTKSTRGVPSVWLPRLPCRPASTNPASPDAAGLAVQADVRARRG